MQTYLIPVLALALTPMTVLGQANKPDPYASRILLGPESYTWESVREPAPRVASRAPVRSTASRPATSPVSLGTQRVLDYYGGMQARMALSQMPGRPQSVGAAPAAGSHVATKPFNTVVNTPTVSPYMNLHREEQNGDSLNYFAFVRPQQQQIEANQQQVQRLQQLERRINRASSVAPGYTPSPTGSAARFGDTGRYYSGWNR